MPPAVPAPPTRVVLCTDTFGDVNGVCRFLQDVARRARTTGRPLMVCTSTFKPVPEDASNVRNFRPVFAKPMPRYPELDLVLPPFGRMLREIRRFGPTAIHASTPGPVGLLGVAAAKMLGVPLLGTHHTDFPAYIHELFGPLLGGWAAGCFGELYRGFDAVVSRSEAYARSIAALGVPERKIVPLPYGVDTALFSPGCADAGVWSRMGIGGARVRALYVGRVSKEKNTVGIEQAWSCAQAQLRGRGVDAELVVVGDGPDRARLEGALAGRGARFLGFRHGPELSALYASSDLFVFPSVTDTLGQSVLEAQASGLPAVVSHLGGPCQVVQDGATGFVRDPSDTGSWAGAIVRLCTESRLRWAFGAAARKGVERLSLDASLDAFWGLHAAATEGRPLVVPASAEAVPA